MMRNVISETDMAILFQSFENINELCILPVKPKNEPLALGESLKGVLNLVMVLLEFDCDSVHSLFDQQLFCFYYSLFKRFLDSLNKDFRGHLVNTSSIVIDQVFRNFDEQKFTQSHPLSFPDSASREYAVFKQAGHAQSYFRLITVTKYLLGNLSKKVQAEDLNKIAYDCISETMKYLFSCSQYLKDSFDASLFVVKNLLSLYQFLDEIFQTKGVAIKLEQRSYEPSSSGISKFLGSSFDFATIRNVVLDLMPKINSYSVDLRENVCKVLNHIFE